MMISRTRTAVLTALICLPLAAACGDAGGSGASLNVGVSGSGSGGSTSASTGSDSEIDLTAGNQSSAATGGFEECATTSDEAQLIPINMFITIDKSGSMDNNGKWNNTKAAFNAFFTDPGADGLNVALRFWPDDGCSESAGCDVQACATPQVELGSLAAGDHEQLLMSTFDDKSPGGSTPTSAAIEGATKFALDQSTASEGQEKTVVILVTDGEPTSCDTSLQTIAGHAESAYAQGEILTFAVGLEGSNENQMNQIAQAGGTDQAFFIGNGNAEEELLAALQEIQQSIVACTFAMPESDDPSNPVDPNQINVTYEPADGSDEQTILQVNDESECSAMTGGWFYDDPANPATINLCQSTCTVVQSDSAAKVRVVLGCKTEVN